MATEGKNALIPPKRANTDYPVRPIPLLYGRFSLRINR
jgi:hypothetical protein